MALIKRIWIRVNRLNLSEVESLTDSFIMYDLFILFNARSCARVDYRSVYEDTVIYIFYDKDQISKEQKKTKLIKIYPVLSA